VFHVQDRTYTMIVAEDYPGMLCSVTAPYRALREGLLHGLR